MGIHPKIGITGLPRSGKSAVLEKVVSMIIEERKQEKRARNEDPNLCLLYTSPSPRDLSTSRMPSSA